VCCCRYHIQVLFLLEALNSFRDPCKGAHVNFNCDCKCIVCGFDNGGVAMSGLVVMQAYGIVVLCSM
jgi:hypothetical protein